MRKTLLLKLAAISIGILLSLVIAETVLRIQDFVKLDGFRNEAPWDDVLHHGGKEFTVRDYGSNCKGETIKLLLLGDSWMQDGYSLSKTMGQELASKTGKCVQAINGGASSYAPTLYLLRARQAFTAYGRFDYIIVNIDETDIGDEWLRYRIPAVKNSSGDIVAVPYENDFASQYIWNGKLWAEDSNFYIIRLLKFAFLYRVLIPSVYKFTVSPDLYENLMQYVFAPEARTLFKKEHEYFEGRLTKLATQITSFVYDAKNVYLTHHPHLRGLVDTVEKGRLYLPVVSEILERVEKKTGVKVLDARNHLERIHGTLSFEEIYEEGDNFSHLFDVGETNYGKWIVEQIDVK